MSKHNIVYTETNGAEKGVNFVEVVFEGSFAAALEHAKNLANTAKNFLLGQVLAQDGKVLATVAPQGSVRLSSE